MGFSFSFSIASKVPVFMNSANFSNIVLPIAFIFNAFNCDGVNDFCSNLFNSAAAFLYAIALKISPLFFIKISNCPNIFMKSFMLPSVCFMLYSFFVFFLSVFVFSIFFNFSLICFFKVVFDGEFVGEIIVILYKCYNITINITINNY